MIGSPHRAYEGYTGFYREKSDDGCGDVYIYGEVNENQISTSPSIKIKLPNSHEIEGYHTLVN
jgi:hypothetical protein